MGQTKRNIGHVIVHTLIIILFSHYMVICDGIQKKFVKLIQLL